MKSIKKSVVLILSGIFAVIGFSACSNDLDAIDQAANINVSINSDVRVVESGYVRTQVNSKFLSRGEDNDLKPKDITITPVSESQAKAFTTGEAGDDGKSTVSTYRWVTLFYRCKTADGTMNNQRAYKFSQNPKKFYAWGTNGMLTFTYKF